jgi:hypothetical protein
MRRDVGLRAATASGAPLMVIDTSAVYAAIAVGAERGEAFF